jgi:transmembrane sensor
VKSGSVAVGTTIVRENQLAKIAPGGGMSVRELRGEDVERRFAWTAGYVSFSGETLAEAVEEINRYNARKLVISDRTIHSLTIGGKFLATDVDSFVAALRPLGVRRLKDDLAPGDDTIRLVGSGVRGR